MLNLAVRHLSADLKPSSAALLAAARGAFTDALVITATVSAALVVMAAILAAVVLRDVRPHELTSGEAPALAGE